MRTRLATLAALLAGTSVASAQPNDDCTSATPISGPGSFAFDNSTATADGASHSECDFFGFDFIARDVWYCWTATESGVATLTTCGLTAVDTKVAVFDGCGCPGITVVACNDDACPGFQSELTFEAVAGQSYLIEIGTWPDAVSGGVGSFQITTAAVEVENDNCADAIAIAGDGLFDFDNSDATADGPSHPECNSFGFDSIDRDLWYRWTADQDGFVQFATCGLTALDTKIAVYSEVACPPTEIIGCSEDNCGVQSQIVFETLAGEEYMLRVGNWPGTPEGGTGSFSLSTVSGEPAPNDDCAMAEILSGDGTFVFNNTLAGTDGEDHPLCDAYGSEGVAADVWFRWTPDVTGAATVTTCGQTLTDTRLAIYTAGECPGTGRILTCNDDACAKQSELSVNVEAGSEYLIRLGAHPSNPLGGTGTFSITTVPGNRIDHGVNVITGNVNSVQLHGSTASHTGYSLGTIICNVGNQVMPVISGIPQHPVISQSMYRLKNGRFEQLGASWVKHMIGSLNDDFCDTCHNPGDFNLMGPGCSDAYGSGLNGTQSILGPRSDINATTGTFPYPYTIAFNQSGNSVYKRLQTVTSEVDPAKNPDAVYVVEACYVYPTDAQHGFGLDNTTWRRISPSITSNPAFIGAFHQREPAIFAWRFHDPEVEITSVDYQEQGLDARFYVGVKTTDLGDGTWRYEYAVQNMNSHRSGGDFSVPLPDRAVATDLFFRDVDYHSGEPYDNTDWIPSPGPDAVRWSCPETFQENENTNALRWGTLYNFGFTANVAPAPGSVTLGLFRPGALGDPDVLHAEAVVPGGAGGGCAADWTGDGVLNSADLFAFLSDFDAGDADFNGDGSTNSLDFFGFLEAFEAGCD